MKLTFCMHDKKDLSWKPKTNITYDITKLTLKHKDFSSNFSKPIKSSKN